MTAIPRRLVPPKETLGLLVVITPVPVCLTRTWNTALDGITNAFVSVVIRPRVSTGPPGVWIWFVTPPEMTHALSLVVVVWFKRKETVPLPLFVRLVAYGVAVAT